MATKADCTCTDPDAGWFDVDCPDRVVFYLDDDEGADDDDEAISKL